MKMILQKIIAQTGYASRRQGEALIRQGAVKINGRTAIIGETADPNKDIIIVKGRRLAGQAEKIYLKLNKPRDYVCTNRRFPGEKNIFSLIAIKPRLFAVGRLDKNSHGLVLLTNDGALTQKLSHPKFQQEKIYEVKISREADQRSSASPAEDMKRIDLIREKFIQGIDIGEGDGLARAKKIQYLQNDLFVITLNEGKKRQIRRMFKVLGANVVDLKRVGLAGLELGSLAEGHWAYLSKKEINQLKI